MKLVRFSKDGITHVGALKDGGVVDFSTSAPSLPADMLAFLAQGEDALSVAEDVLETAQIIPIDQVRLEAPIVRPPKILAIGLNYKDHIAETGREAPKVPFVFNKQSTSASGPFDDIHYVRDSDKLDYEGELGIVIGKRCRRVPADKAMDVIAGFTVVNDVSVRDWQMRSPTFTMGKSWDTHCPFGPAIVTKDEIEDPHALDIKTWVNGELRQDSNTKHLLFDCFTLIEHLSTVFTLEPGDIIATGTPSGVAIGFEPPKFLVPGDVIKIEIEKIGAIENKIIVEPDTACF